jgi:hypothetical protein
MGPPWITQNSSRRADFSHLRSRLCSVETSSGRCAISSGTTGRFSPHSLSCSDSFDAAYEHHGGEARPRHFLSRRRFAHLANAHVGHLMFDILGLVGPIVVVSEARTHAPLALSEYELCRLDLGSRLALPRSRESHTGAAERVVRHAPFSSPSSLSLPWRPNQSLQPKRKTQILTVDASRSNYSG